MLIAQTVNKMPTIKEGKLTFTFAQGVEAEKYDDWAFYRNQFQNHCYHDNKAVDILCYLGQNAWMIEIKDYRQHPRSKLIDLADEIALKVRDTLAGLVAAQINATNPNEKNFSRDFLGKRCIKIILHLEQPTCTNRLRPHAINFRDVQDKLKQQLKAIDPHPKVTCISSPSQNNLPWTVH